MTETGINKEDLRAAVQTGIMNEAQAAHLIALADARVGARAAVGPSDEPFELFKGFNEIFIVVGLFILYLGWYGIASLSGFASGDGTSAAMFFGGVAAIVSVGLAIYFTRKRRMVLPSIFLTMAFASAVLLVFAGFGPNVLFSPSTLAIMGAAYFGLMLGWWFVFHVPFTMVLIGMSALFLVFSIVRASGGPDMMLFDILIQSGRGPAAIITLVTGLIGVAIAMAFDMSDPHRVTRRAADGFWLHVISAMAVIHTVAIRLLSNDTPLSHLALLGFVVFCALFAIIVDRRSFLVSSVGYVVALALAVVGGGAAFIAILFLGILLVFLGAFWDQIRAGIMNILPGFPGKTRLPPWANAKHGLSHV